MLSEPRNQRVSPDPKNNFWELLQASREWAPLSRKIAPWIMSLTWLMQAVFPWLLGKGVDAAFPNETATADEQQLAFWVSAMVALAIAVFPGLALRHHTTFEVRLSTQYWLLTGLQQKAVAGGATQADALPPGKVLTAAAADTQSMGMFSMQSVQLMGWLTAIGVALGLTALASPMLAAAMLAGVVLSAIITSPIGRTFQKHLAAQRKTLAQLTNHASDGISGLRVLRGVGGQDQFLDEYRRRSDADRDAAIRAETRLAAILAVAALTPGVLTLLLVTWGAIMVQDGDLLPGDLVMVAGATRFIFMPVSQLGTFPSQISKARVATSRLNDIFAVPTHVDPADLRTDALPQGTLYDPATQLSFEPRKFSMVLAHEPYTATRLARRLARLETNVPAATLNGEPLELWPLDTVRQSIVLNDTHPLLLSGTLRSQLDPAGIYSDDWLLKCLHVAAADDVLDLLPEGLDDYVSERGRSLSGGQRQRVALARVLARNPEVLILVEPTSAVDAFTESMVAERLPEFRRGKTTIVISTSPLLADRADTVMRLAEGVTA